MGRPRNSRKCGPSAPYPSIPKPIDDDRQAIGEVRARYESDLGFRVSGKVVARLVDIGVSVKRATCWPGSTSRNTATG
jgi:multidrug efflux pump subunit AcrA (membrane-fusion protein)